MLRHTLPSIILVLLLSASAHSQLNQKGEKFPEINLDNGIIAATSSSSQPQNIRRAGKSNRAQTSPVGDRLKTHKEKVANWYGMSGKDLDKISNRDGCLKVDDKGRLYHACGELLGAKTKRAITQTTAEIQASSNSYNQSSSGPLNFTPTSYIVNQTNIPTSMAFELESMPGAKRTIYLDFNGHVSTQTGWNGIQRPVIDSLPMDLDNTPSSFTENELRAIINIWLHVLEDFAPFEVNITTKEPPLDKLIRTNPQDTDFGIRAVITGNDVPLVPRVGGIAMLGSFTWNTDTPCFIFSHNLSRNPKYIAETVSHEVGHTLGLHHDGIGTAAYHYGTGNWAPIMGVSFYRNISQWSKGDYAGANNTQDDLKIISELLPLKQEEEEHPKYINGMEIEINGTVGGLQDRDLFIIDASNAEVSISANRAPIFPNLNLNYTIFSESGKITHSLPATSFEMLNNQKINLEKGRYYLSVTGSPVPEAGSSYGSVGNYQLNITQQKIRPEIKSVELNRKGIIRINETLKVENVTAENYEGETPKINYGWESKSPTSDEFLAIEGANAQELYIAHDLIGHTIRATVVAENNLGKGSPTKTRPIKVVSQPTIIAKKGESFIFSSQQNPWKASPFEKGIWINEISRAYQHGENSEWIELLILKDSDLRGYKLTSGIDTLIFKNSPEWQYIPRGTTITIYNGLERDPLLPQDTFAPWDQKRIIVSSTDSNLFEGSWTKISRNELIPFYSSGFEDGAKTAYPIGTPPTPIVFSGTPFLLDDALIGTETGDLKEGAKSVRMRNGSITMPGYFAEGISKISFKYGRSNFLGDRTGTSPKIVLEFRKREEPNTWIQIGDAIDLTGVNELKEFTASVNLPSDCGLRIRKISGTSGKRFNIDSLLVNPQDKGRTITLNDPSNALIHSLALWDNPNQIRADFLKPGQAESFHGENASLLSEGQSWKPLTWAKPQISNTNGIESLNFGLTPSLANNEQNATLIKMLQSDSIETDSTYNLISTPLGSEITLNPKSGVGTGKISSPGVHQIVLEIGKVTETIEIIVTQSFKEKLEELGLQWSNDPLVDIGLNDTDHDSYSNLLEYSLGLNINSYSNENKIFGGLERVGNKNYLNLTYQKAIGIEGIDISVESSTDLRNWSALGIEYTTLTKNSTIEIVKARKEIPTTNPRLFLRLKINPTDPELIQAGIKAQNSRTAGSDEIKIAGTRTTNVRVPNAISIPLLDRAEYIPRIGVVEFVADAGTIRSKFRMGNELFRRGTEKFAIQMTSGNAKGQIFLLHWVHPDGRWLYMRDPYHRNLDMRTSGVSANDTFNFIRVHTIKSLFGTPSDGFIQGGPTANTADLVKIITDGVENSYYYNTTVNRWVNTRDINTSVDDLALHPHYGLTYEKLGIGGAILIQGEVPTEARTMKVKDSGTTHLSHYYPIETKLRNLGVEKTEGWISSTNSSLADKVTLTTPSGSRFQAYHDGTNWRRLSLGTPITNESDISTTSSIQINRRVTNPKGFALFSQPLPNNE